MGPARITLMSNASGSWAVLGRFDDSPQLRADLDAIAQLRVQGAQGQVSLAPASLRAQLAHRPPQRLIDRIVHTASVHRLVLFTF